VSTTPFTRLRDWTEPAHPAVVRLHEGLIQVYRVMHERQREIDAAFDRVSSQIGFVVTTTLPVRMDVGGDGAVKSAALDGEALSGTLFEKEFPSLVGQLTSKPLTNVPAGSYRFYLIWYNALKLKLRRDWLEPVHVIRGLVDAIVGQQGPAAALPATAAAVRPEVREPAHWFDPGIAIAVEDAVVISAIDEVYPELRLAERIAADRLAIRRIRPEVMEPVHFRDLLGLKERDVLSEVRAILAKQRG
jgi:hypothetical protein